MEQQIILKTTYTEQDYRNFLFRHLYGGWGIKIVVAIAILIALTDLLYLFSPAARSAFPDGLPTFNIVVPVVVLLGLPIFIIVIAKKAFNSNFRLQEDISLIITDNHFQEKGETFEVTTPWSQIKGIAEKKDLFIIRHDNYKNGFIPKRFFSDVQLNDFKVLSASLKSQKRIKN